MGGDIDSDGGDGNKRVKVGVISGRYGSDGIGLNGWCGGLW